jgi:hypothetical protein
MAIQWYVQHNGKQYGPLTSANLKKLADEGKISPATQVRSGTEGAWVPASRVQGLFAAATAPAAGSQAAVPPRAAAPRQPATVASPPIAPPPAPPLGRAVARNPLARATVAPLPKAVPTASGSMPAKILGAVALILGILALATCWLPMLGGLMGWTAIVVGSLGLLLGIGGLVLSAMHKGSGLALGIAGSSSSLVGLVLAVVLGIQFKLFESAPLPKPVAIIPVAAAPPQQEAPPQVAEPVPEPEPQWTDASEPIQQGDIKARIASVKIENVKFERDLIIGRPKKSETMLKVRVAIENTSSDKIFEVPGWIGGSDLVGQGIGELLGAEAGKALQSATASATLADNVGNKYKQTPMLSLFNAGSTLGKDSAVRPGQSSETELVFPVPLPTIEYLRLELSPAGFGGSDSLRFQIPKAMIAGLPPSGGSNSNKGTQNSSENKPLSEAQIASWFERSLRSNEELAKQSEYVVTSIKFDASRSDSLVHPFTATATYRSCWKRLVDNEKAWYEHQDTFGWREGRWQVIQRLMRQPTYGLPLRDAHSDGFLKRDRNGNFKGGHLLDDLFQLEDAAFAHK